MPQERDIVTQLKDSRRRLTHVHVYGGDATPVDDHGTPHVRVKGVLYRWAYTIEGDTRALNEYVGTRLDLRGTDWLTIVNPGFVFVLPHDGSKNGFKTPVDVYNRVQ